MHTYDLKDNFIAFSKNFLKYFGYGYTKFNYYHCYPKAYNIEANDKEISYKDINK